MARWRWRGRLVTRQRRRGRLLTCRGRLRARPVTARRHLPARRPMVAGPDDLLTNGALMHLIAIGGSDAGISAALRARELGPGCEVTVVVADAYPNFSICGIPYYVSGEVTDW